MQNQELWPEPHRRRASCSRPRSSSIYKDPPRTRQRTLILAAFLPWGGSDDTVTRRTGPQHTRFHPARAAAAKRSTSPQDCPPTTCRGAGAQYQGRAWPRCRWAAAGPGRASRRRTEQSSRRGRLAGGPPPTGTHSGPAHQVRPHGTHNTRRHRQQKPRNLKRSRGPVAEDGGFEPPRACTQHAFQACAIGH